MTIELTIHDLNHDGEGVAYFEGYTYFVAGALPGEVIEAEPFLKKRRFGRAKLVNILTPSPDRISPPCPYFGTCGGCQLQHLEEKAQLTFKTKKVRDALEKIGKLDVEVLPCIASEKTFGYRNKIQLPVREEGMGLYARNSNHLVAIDACLIHCELGEAVFQVVRDVLAKHTISPYDPQTGKGELRHVLIKTAVHTGEVLVIFVTNGEKNEKLQEVAKEIRSRHSAVKGVVQNKQTEQSNVILGREFSPLDGELFIREKLLNLFFKASPPSFFQVNPGQAERLYSKCLEFAEMRGNERVLDAYCGVGTLSLVFARQASEVIGVECVQEAIEDAKENAQLNGIENVAFHCAPAEEFIQTLEPVDVALLNPPRKGCDERFLQALGRLKPKKVFYISCDPATLARDLHILKELGFETTTVQPFDMFPQTSHVESLATISLKIC